MKFTAEDEKYLNIENLQIFKWWGCLFIEYWKDLENGDTSNRDKDEVKILTKGDNIEEILKKIWITYLVIVINIKMVKI